MPKIRSRMKRWTKNIPFNIIKFVNELKKEEFTPIYYLTFI